jgi:hemolysin-activating ACP:hemolysin acyltransferase
MPKDYGLHKDRKGMLRWSDIVKQLTNARNYWICTTREDGRPHAMPVWGFWDDGAVVFGTGVGTLKARNLRANPNVVIHLESGNDVVILECVAKEGNAEELVKRLDAMCRKKYKMPATVMPESVMYVARPRVALAWRERDFPTSATRWKLAK